MDAYIAWDLGGTSAMQGAISICTYPKISFVFVWFGVQYCGLPLLESHLVVSMA